MYIADIYSAYTKDMNLYGTKAIQIPLPSFIIFYNGREQQPDRTEYLLSDLFHPTADHPALELKAVMLNINKGHNQELMDASEIKAYLQEKHAELIASGNKGQIMKTIMPELKGKADGKVINQVVAEFCK